MPAQRGTKPNIRAAPELYHLRCIDGLEGEKKPGFEWRSGSVVVMSRQFRVGGHGAVLNTLNAMDNAAEFDRAGASFRRRRKRASTDLTFLSTVPTPA